MATDNRQWLKELRNVAEAYGLIVQEYGTEFKLYRQIDGRASFIGKRATLNGLQTLLAKVTGWRPNRK